MTNTSWNLDENQYNQIVNELKNGATVSVNIGLFGTKFVTANAVILGEYAYQLTNNDTLCRYDTKYDFPDVVTKSEFNKPENVAKRQAQKAEQDKEAEEWGQMTEWFLAHPSA